MGQVEDGAVGLGMTTYVSPVQSITPKQKVTHVNQLHTCLHAYLARYGTGHRADRSKALNVDQCVQACKRACNIIFHRTSQ